MGCLDFIGGIAQGTGTITAAKINADATSHAADLASASNAETLKFQREQAEKDYQNQETTRRANYDQHVAQVTANNRVRQAMGLAPVPVPAYVPSIDPGFTGPAPAAGGPSIGGMAGAPTAAPASTAPSVETPQMRAQAALRAAAAPTAPNFIQPNGMTLGALAGAPNGQPSTAPWNAWTPEELAALRNKVQT